MPDSPREVVRPPEPVLGRLVGQLRVEDPEEAFKVIRDIAVAGVRARVSAADVTSTVVRYRRVRRLGPSVADAILIADRWALEGLSPHFALWVRINDREIEILATEPVWVLPTAWHGPARPCSGIKPADLTEVLIGTALDHQYGHFDAGALRYLAEATAGEGGKVSVRVTPPLVPWVVDVEVNLFAPGRALVTAATVRRESSHRPPKVEDILSLRETRQYQNLIVGGCAPPQAACWTLSGTDVVRRDGAIEFGTTIWDEDVRVHVTPDGTIKLIRRDGQMSRPPRAT